ncbi:MAG: response regulator [Endomicrobiales bacterium]|nr:response regulator [Endomicrobiales bacterium]
MAKKAMVVDDEPEVRETIRRYLEKHGVEAVTAADCEECLEHLKAGFTGVIFMDLIMPKKDGWDVVREIASQGYEKKAVIVLLTASVDPAPEKSKDLIQYVADYIPKPSSLKEVVKAAKKYLGIKDS